MQHSKSNPVPSVELPPMDSGPALDPCHGVLGVGPEQIQESAFERFTRDYLARIAADLDLSYDELAGTFADNEFLRLARAL